MSHLSSLSRLFIMRPIATTLISVILLLAFGLGYCHLPAADPPALDFPMIVVQAQQPGVAAA